MRLFFACLFHAVIRAVMLRGCEMLHLFGTQQSRLITEYLLPLPPSVADNERSRASSHADADPAFVKPCGAAATHAISPVHPFQQVNDARLHLGPP